MTIIATVVYPVNVVLEIEGELTEDEIKEMVLEEADKLFQSSPPKPMITESNNEELID